MSLSLGEKLRAAREQRGITISEVAEQTRISPLYLEAIDADNYKTLPGGIFNKGFVRSYAKYVGIDEQEALLDYTRLVAENESVDDREFKAYRPEVLTDDRSTSSIVPTVIFAAVILGLMSAGILFLVNYIQNQQSEPPIAANSVAVNANQSNNAAVNSVPQQPTQTAVGGPFKVEFAAIGDAISLTSVTDNGRSTEVLLAPGSPLVFEATESLKLRYSKSRAQFAQLKLNGKSIALPNEPANPKASNIEIDLNQGNVTQVFQNGAITFGATTATTDTNTASVPAPVRPTPRPASSARPATANANTAPTPAGVPTMTVRPRPNSTPVVVGNATRTPNGN